MKQYIRGWLNVPTLEESTVTMKQELRAEVQSVLYDIFIQDKFRGNPGENWKVREMATTVDKMINSAVAARCRTEACEMATNTLMDLVSQEHFLDSIITRILSKQLK